MRDDIFDMFFGAANAVECRIYVRAPRETLPPDVKLSGAVIGPSSLFAHTLSASIPLLDRSTAASCLAEAIVPDPCLWTMESPFMYEVHVEARVGDNIVASTSRPFGVRPLGAWQTGLVFDSKPWVLRAVECRAETNGDWAAWRSTATALWIREPSEATCAAASRQGVLLVAEIGGDNQERRAAEIRRLARWPAVGIAVIDQGLSLPNEIRRGAENLLLAERFVDAQPITPAPWAQLIVCESPSADDIARRASSCNLPVIARRPSGGATDVADSRRACDLLQRDLAYYGQFAGYAV